MTPEISVVAVILAAVANIVIGFIWYSPKVFGAAWMKEAGLSKADLEKGKKGMGGKMLAMVGTSVIAAYVLAHVSWMAEQTEVGTAISTGFWMWFGFIATVLLGSVLWEGKSLKYWVINSAYWLVGLIAMGAIIQTL